MSKKRPPAKDKPRIGRPPTGQMRQFQFRMPAEKHAKCQRKAESQGKTLSQIVREYLDWWLAQ